MRASHRISHLDQPHRTLELRCLSTYITFTGTWPMFCKASGTCQCVITPLDPPGRLVCLVKFERRTCPAPLVYTRLKHRSTSSSADWIPRNCLPQGDVKCPGFRTSNTHCLPLWFLGLLL